MIVVTPFASTYCPAGMGTSSICTPPPRSTNCGKASFTRAQREYTKNLRWSDIEAAARFVHPEMREQFLSYEQEFDGIRVTDFEVGEITFGEGERTATVRVTYYAYSMASMLEREIKETQDWERLGRDNSWVVRPKLEGIVERVADLR